MEVEVKVKGGAGRAEQQSESRAVYSNHWAGESDELNPTPGPDPNRRAKGEVGGGGEESEVESNWSNDDDEVLLEVADY